MFSLSRWLSSSQSDPSITFASSTGSHRPCGFGRYRMNHAIALRQKISSIPTTSSFVGRPTSASLASSLYSSLIFPRQPVSLHNTAFLRNPSNPVNTTACLQLNNASLFAYRPADAPVMQVVELATLLTKRTAFKTQKPTHAPVTRQNRLPELGVESPNTLLATAALLLVASTVASYYNQGIRSN